MYASYNPDYLNYINDKFKDMTLEDKKELMHKEQS